MNQGIYVKVLPWPCLWIKSGEFHNESWQLLLNQNNQLPQQSGIFLKLSLSSKNRQQLQLLYVKQKKNLVKCLKRSHCCALCAKNQLYRDETRSVKTRIPNRPCPSLGTQAQGLVWNCTPRTLLKDKALILSLSGRVWVEKKEGTMGEKTREINRFL